ncbi:MAG: bifunctional phosphoribosyl-AMP cyclohydrolase/phosphoribosyl-ATP diphosphatase HisIE [Candidatus Izimaplasma sp.]|nr:bifunctional phosphoribosyl-AMP cyclohydrolase/phosphoribosyl-ATP diphosphatase HisIE [Candidatus Izimaplasma bacterium]
MIEISYNKDGLVPVITQDYETNDVLMLAYMNQEAFTKTINEKKAYYYSRSRQELWLKGETSGSTQQVKELRYDCDQDALLLKVKQTGVACHTGNKSCFYRTVFSELTASNNIINQVYELIKDRKEQMPKGSYTTYLFEKGLDKILKKIAEESGEVIIGAKNTNEELIYEMSDLVYHSLVLLVNQDVSLEKIKNELAKRFKN